jgi:hypothetical protein
MEKEFDSLFSIEIIKLNIAFHSQREQIINKYQPY